MTGGRADATIHLMGTPATASDLSNVASETIDAFTIYSVGYERRTIHELITLLDQYQIVVLVDVRLNAISRKQGFSKTALRKALEDADIGYIHKRHLGNPKDNREDFRQGSHSARQRYIEHLKNGASSAYQEIIEIAQAKRTALLCYERNHDECHRSCILAEAEADYDGITVERLGQD